MADLSPFRGWRFDLGRVGELSSVLAPPPSRLDAATRERLLQMAPFHSVRLIPEGHPGAATRGEAEHRAARHFKDWQTEGILRQDASPAYYFVQQCFAWEGRARRRSVIVALGHSEARKTGTPAPISGLEFLSPIVGFCDGVDPALVKWLEEATSRTLSLTATDWEGVVHRMWPIHQGDLVQTIRAAFHRTPSIAIPLGQAFDPAHAEVLLALVAWDDPGLAALPCHAVGGPGTAAALVRRMEVWQLRGDMEQVGEGPTAAQACWEMVAAAGGEYVGLGTAAQQAWYLIRLNEAERHELFATAPRNHDWTEVAQSIADGTSDWALLAPPPDLEVVRSQVAAARGIVTINLAVHPLFPVGLVFHANR